VVGNTGSQDMMWDSVPNELVRIAPGQLPPLPCGKGASDLPHDPLSKSMSSEKATQPSAVIPQNSGTLPSGS
jgi:hypothetical protein